MADNDGQDDINDMHGAEDNGTDEPPSKRSRSEGRRLECRVLIQSKCAGAIIGKGGTNISRLRSEYKATVTVPDCPGPERVLTVMADADTTCDVLLDIIPKINDDRDGDSELRMLVHQSQVGGIIGRAGFKIKELREQTGANIKVYSQCCPSSTERIVQVSGAPKVIIDCVQKIFDLLYDSPIKGVNHAYDPNNFDEMYANEYGGYGGDNFGGRGGGRMGGGGGGGGMGGGMRGGGGFRGGRFGDRGAGGGRFGGRGGMQGGFGGGRDMERRPGGMMRNQSGGFR